MDDKLKAGDFVASFADVVKIIETSRDAAFRKVNEELIHMYWRVGEYLSEAMKDSKYGDGYIQSLADFIAENYPEIKGFNRRGLYRMKQFYELYAGTEIVSTLLTQLGWSIHLKLMSACKTWKCVQEKGLEFCSDCNQFPCSYLAPTFQGASFPHNMKVYNLCRIRLVGINAWIEESADIRKHYYDGEFVVGEGPILKNE